MPCGGPQRPAPPPADPRALFVWYRTVNDVPPHVWAVAKALGVDRCGACKQWLDFSCFVDHYNCCKVCIKRTGKDINLMEVGCLRIGFAG